MLKVKTRLDKSPVEGIGLFAAQSIKKGEIVWEFSSDVDLVYRPNQVLAMTDPNLKEFISRYTYYSKGLGGYVLCGDNARFVNHSKSSNILCIDNEVCIASRDIADGEEIMDNYLSYDVPEGEEFFPDAYILERELAGAEGAHIYTNGATPATNGASSGG